MLDCWQATSEGFYDSQMGDGEELGMRGVYRTDSDGRYLVRTTRPKFYPVPTDGPVGDMLRATDRHPFRPGHVHFMITAPGYQPLVTHIFDKSGEYLDSDTVFAVKDSLKVDFHEQSTLEAIGQRAGVQPPYVTAEFDFALSPLDSQNVKDDTWKVSTKHSSFVRTYLSSCSSCSLVTRISSNRIWGGAELVRRAYRILDVHVIPVPLCRIRKTGHVDRFNRRSGVRPVEADLQVGRPWPRASCIAATNRSSCESRNPRDRLPEATALKPSPCSRRDSSLKLAAAK